MKFCQTSLQISIENLSKIFPRVEIPGRSSVPCSTLVESVSINYSIINRSANYDITDLGQSLNFNTAFDEIPRETVYFHLFSRSKYYIYPAGVKYN